MTSDETRGVDLDAITEKWLRVCGCCDAGLPKDCVCPDGDPRDVIDALVAEVRVLRDQRDTALAQKVVDAVLAVEVPLVSYHGKEAGWFCVDADMVGEVRRAALAALSGKDTER